MVDTSQKITAPANQPATSLATQELAPTSSELTIQASHTGTNNLPVTLEKGLLQFSTSGKQAKPIGRVLDQVNVRHTPSELTSGPVREQLAIAHDNHCLHFMETQLGFSVNQSTLPMPGDFVT